MAPNDSAYVKLQQHLDKQAVGFPATRSRVELNILKHIFTPAEAEIATHLSYQMYPLDTIFGKVRHRVDSPAQLETILEGIQKKGGVESKLKNGVMHYACAPFVVGMYELQLERLTPAFIRDFNTYISDFNFGIEFLSTELPQMRTIPISKSIRPRHHVSTFDEAAGLLHQAEGPFVIIDCICRKKRSLEGKPCKATDRKETCLGIGDIAQMVLRNDVGREITRDEAVSILELNQEDGLVLQPSNTEKADFICSCCGCCCGMLKMQKGLPRPVDFWASNFQAAVDATSCRGCGACTERCQVKAVSVSEKHRTALVDLNRCIGCGLCVPVCPTESISLVKKPVERTPPPTREDLYDFIMARKKGRVGKWKLTGKLMVDAIRTGQAHLLKP